MGTGLSSRCVIVPLFCRAAHKQGDLSVGRGQPPGAPLQGPSPALRKLAKSCPNCHALSLWQGPPTASP